MQFIFSLMSDADVRVIQTWQYEGQYAIYSIPAGEEESAAAEMLERRSPYYAVCDENGELTGFFCFGTSAQPWSNEVPGLYGDNRLLDIGLGMRPDLTGKGLGLAFVQAGLSFARAQFAPLAFRLFVFAFNERAIRVYEKAGFERTDTLLQQDTNGERIFVEMRRAA